MWMSRTEMQSKKSFTLVFESKVLGLSPKTDRPSWMVLSLAADDGGDGVSASETEGGAADVLLPVHHCIEESGEHTCSGASDGVSECDGSSVDVEDLIRDSEIS